MPAQEAVVQPLERLKSIVLSIDWEITDSCLSDLIDETNHLLPMFQKMRMQHALLRMLNSLGRYIRKRKAQAHPDAIKRILSVFASLEKIADPANSNESIKKGILTKEINAFKKLKQQIELQKSVSKEMALKNGYDDEPIAFVDQRKFEQTLSAVEKKLLGEVEALKTNMARLQKELDILRKS